MLDELSPRQRAVLLGMCLGRTNRQLADEIGVGLRTVEYETDVIRKAAKAPDKTSAVVKILHGTRLGKLAVDDLLTFLSRTDDEARNCPCCGRLIEPNVASCGQQEAGVA